MIFFDVDNTLIDYSRGEANAIMSLCRHLKVIVNDRAAQVKKWQSITASCFEEYLSGHLSFSEQRIERIKQFFLDDLIHIPGTDRSVLTSQLDDKTLCLLSDKYLELFEENWCLFPDVEAFFQMPSKPRCGIITNGNTKQQMKKLTAVGLSQMFEIIVTSEESGCSKPDKKIFEYAANKTKTPKNQRYYIGDDFEKDIVGAKNAGMKAIWLNRSSTDVAHAYEGVEVINDLYDPLIHAIVLEI